ncbi:MAG: MBL fold metallo-hydrolase [Saprospiraceae bacterium]|nr:MBL fold metallo-hydrolase [Saprospiraceae bacterium]
MTQLKSFAFNPFSENTYVLFDDATKEAIIFDPGCYMSYERTMLTKFISDNQLVVKRLINTHCHLDHVFGNPFVSEKYNVSMECHRAELPVLARVEQAGMMFGTPCPPQEPPTHFIEDDATIQLGSIELRTILAPGHSPGSLCFYNEKDKFLIGGDVLFFGSIGRTDLPGGNHKQLIESIQTRLMPLPDDVKVYSGHGQPTTIGRERLHNPFLN